MNGQSRQEQFFVLVETNRRLRREIDKLREQAGKESISSREFDRQNQDVFSLVRKNRDRRCANA